MQGLGLHAQGADAFPYAHKSAGVAASCHGHPYHGTQQLARILGAVVKGYDTQVPGSFIQAFPGIDGIWVVD